ncbi:MAG: sugar porter family MFS transporter [Promethearchaeota archaeon]
MQNNTLLNEKSNNMFIYFIAAVSGISGMLFGYDTGVISGAILFIRSEFNLSPFLTGLVVSAVLIGAVIGAFLGGYMAENYGRKKVIIFAAIIFIFGAIFTAITPDIIFLIFGRIIVGIAIGIASFTAPLYISEASPPHIRGALVSFNQLAITIGIVISYLVDFSLAPIQGWRYMFGLAVIPGAILLIGMFFLPESPRWLVHHGDIKDGRKVLQRIRDNTNIEVELNEIQTSLEQEKGGRSELLNPKNKPALIIGIALAIFQQVTGINTVIYYAPIIFQYAGFKSSSAAIIATIGVGLVNVGMTIVSIKLLDRVGRRPLLLVGLAGMSATLILLGIIFFLPSLISLIGPLAAISLMLYVAFFAIGLGPVFWLLISEIYPLKIRGTAMSIVTEANWGANLVIALTFLLLIQSIGKSGTFWLYAGVGIMAFIFTFYYVPETKNQTLEEIEEHWRKGKHPLELGK